MGSHLNIKQGVLESHVEEHMIELNGILFAQKRHNAKLVRRVFRFVSEIVFWNELLAGWGVACQRLQRQNEQQEGSEALHAAAFG